MQTLSFQLHEAPIQLDDGVAICVTPQVFIDGKPLTPVIPLDTSGLLALRARSWSADLLTCSCGVSGCAGFHDEVRFERDGDVMRWHVPTCGYEKCVSKEFGEGPWVFSFEAAQYEQVLDALEKELLEREEARGPLLLLSGDSFDSLDSVPDLEDILERAKAWQESAIQEELLYKECFGGLDSFQLVLRDDTSVSLRMTMRGFSRGVEQLNGLHTWGNAPRDWTAIRKVWTEAAALVRTLDDSGLRKLLAGEALMMYFNTFDEAQGRFTYSDVQEQATNALVNGTLSIELAD